MPPAFKLSQNQTLQLNFFGGRPPKRPAQLFKELFASGQRSWFTTIAGLTPCPRRCLAHGAGVDWLCQHTMYFSFAEPRIGTISATSIGAVVPTDAVLGPLSGGCDPIGMAAVPDAAHTCVLTTECQRGRRRDRHRGARRRSCPPPSDGPKSVPNPPNLSSKSGSDSRQADPQRQPTPRRHML